MRKNNPLTTVAAAAGMLVLIFDSKTAVAGAADGIRLCVQTLIPSLFPFFLLSILLTNSLFGQPIPLVRSVTRLCGIPIGSESLLAVGFLGGYPTGAQSVAQMYRSGKLTGLQARKMLPLCNNSGPAFIFGVLGCMFSKKYAVWILWLVHILSALGAAAILPATDGSATLNSSKAVRITDALEQALRVTALVCGWVVLMRIVVAFLDRWFLWMLPQSLQITVAGILELSNGCIRLGEIPQEGLRFLIAGGLLSLGGLCVTLQTASVADGLGLQSYFPGKILQCCISMMMCCLLQPLFPEQHQFSAVAPLFLTAAAISIVITVILRHKNSSGIMAVHGV